MWYAAFNFCIQFNLRRYATAVVAECAHAAAAAAAIKWREARVHRNDEERKAGA
jgi:hypothetical protein